jgi:hypothetical protein
MQDLILLWNYGYLDYFSRTRMIAFNLIEPYCFLSIVLTAPLRQVVTIVSICGIPFEVIGG